MNIPKSWKDITIEKYIAVTNLLSSVTGDELDNEIKMQALLMDVDKKEIEQLKASQFLANTKTLSFMNTPASGKLHYEFKIGKDKFRAALTFDDMKASQFIDFATISKQYAGIKSVYNMHKLIACMCSRKARGIFIDKAGLHFSEYVYDGYDKYCELFFKEMTMDIAYPFYTFFLKTYTALPTAIATSLKLELRKEMRKRKNGKMIHSTNTGDG